MGGAKTGVATRINEIESHPHLTHYHGHALETIKAVKIMRGTLAKLLDGQRNITAKDFR